MRTVHLHESRPIISLAQAAPDRNRACRRRGRAIPVPAAACPPVVPTSPGEPAKPVRKLLIGLAVLLSLAVIAVLVGPGLIDWTRYKPTIERQLTALFDRAVTIEGAVDFAVLPTPILTAEGVRVAGPTADAAPMLEIGALDARVAFAPLLSGTLQVERIALQRPVVTIRQRPEGGTNWGDILGGEDGGDAIRLDRVTIDDGRIDLLGPEGTGRLSATRIFGQVSAETLAGPFQALGSVTVDGRALTVDLETGRLSGAGILPATLRLGIDGADAEGRYAGLIGTDGRLQGEVRLSGSDLAALLARLAPEADVPPVLGRPFALEGRVDGTAEAVQLNALAVEFGDARATGAVSIVPGSVPQIDLALASGRIDLDAWTGGAESSRPIASLLAAVLADRAFAGAASGFLPDGFAVTVDASVDAAAWRDGLIRRIGLTLALAEGRLTVNRLSADLPGSTSLDLDGRIGPAGPVGPGEPPVALRTTVVSEDLRGLLDWLEVPTGSVPPARLRRAQMTATITAGPGEAAVTGIGAELDGTALTGAVRWRPVAPDAPDGAAPGLGLRLQVGRLDLDSYLPDDLRPEHPRALAGQLVPILADPPQLAATVDLGIEHLTLAGRELETVALDAALSRGAVRIDTFSIGDVADAGLSLSGRVAPSRPDDAGGAPPLDLTFHADARDTGRLVEALGLAVPDAILRLGPASSEGRIVGGVAAVDLDARIRALDGMFALGGRVESPTGQAAYDLSLRLTVPEARPLVAAVAPAWRPRGPLGEVDLYAVLTGGPEALIFGDLQGRVAGTALAGQATLRPGGGRPDIEADIRTGALDLTPLLPTPGMPALPGGAGPRWSSTRWPTSWLGGFDARLALTGDSLAVGTWTLADPAARLALEDGVLRAERMSGGLFGGRLALDGRYDLTTDPEALTGSLALTGAPLADVLADLVGAPPVEGTLDFRFDGEAVGRSPASLVATLEGEGLAAVRDGALVGLDLGEIGRRLARLEEPLDFLPILRETIGSGRTPFDALNLPYRVAGGVARTDGLRIAAPAGEGSGAGSLDLSRGRLDLGVDFSLARLPEAPPLGVRLTGSVEDPGLRLATEALQAFLARRAAEALVEP